MVRHAALALLAATALAGCRPESPRSSPREGGAPRQVQSNVTRADYAGSEACAACHPGEHRAWHGSPMRRMTRLATPDAIHAPFAGEDFELGGDRVVMTSTGGERFMQLSAAAGTELFRVTRVIGGRYREDYAGVRVDASAPLGAALGEERVLPASFLLFDESWRYKGYSVMVRARSRLEAGVVWRQTCLFCHNTAPGLAHYYGRLLGDPNASYQGSVSELPPERAFRYKISDEAPIASALQLELARLGRSPPAGTGLEELLRDTLAATRESFGADDLVELGIGCESCHGGSREHVSRPLEVRPTFALRGGVAVETASGRALTEAEEENRTCAKCHTVLFSRYPHTWEGGTRSRAPGGSSMNSGEGRDLLLSRCSVELRCSNCHDPHAEDGSERLASLTGPRGTELCTTCHSQFRGQDRIRAHTRHAPDGPGSACVACHMPKKNLGLAYELTRYHRIGSPTDVERVEGDRPLECALCHVDRSVEQIVTTMERNWGKRYDRAKLRRLYGQDLSINALRATLLGGKPHEELAALGSLPLTETSVPAFQRAVDHEYPLVGLFAGSRLELVTRAPGSPEGEPRQEP